VTIPQDLNMKLKKMKDNFIAHRYFCFKHSYLFAPRTDHTNL